MSHCQGSFGSMNMHYYSPKSMIALFPCRFAWLTNVFFFCGYLKELHLFPVASGRTGPPAAFERAWADTSANQHKFLSFVKGVVREKAGEGECWSCSRLASMAAHSLTHPLTHSLSLSFLYTSFFNVTF